MKCVLIGLILTAGAALGGELQDLQKANLHWQKAFHAESFKIALQVVSEEQLQKIMIAEDPLYLVSPVAILGASNWNVEARQGEIYIISEASYTPSMLKDLGITKRHIRQDQESTLVHEYCHLVWGHAGSEEAGVSLLANLITRIHRKVESK